MIVFRDSEWDGLRRCQQPTATTTTTTTAQQQQQQEQQPQSRLQHFLHNHRTVCAVLQSMQQSWRQLLCVASVRRMLREELGQLLEWKKQQE